MTRMLNSALHPRHTLDRGRLHHQGERGVALIISLIILVIMTIVGVSAVKSNLLEEKMASNSFEQGRLFEAAETALAAGERWVRKKAPAGLVPSPYGTYGLWTWDGPAESADSKPWWFERDVTWWRNEGLPPKDIKNDLIVLAGDLNAYFIAEEQKKCNKSVKQPKGEENNVETCIYRVTALAENQGGIGGRVMLQSVYYVEDVTDNFGSGDGGFDPGNGDADSSSGV